MSLARSVRRTAVAIGLLVFGPCARICQADCGNSVYAYDDKVVVFACAKAGPELRVVLLDDAGILKTAGRVAVPSSREFATAGHYKKFLMLVPGGKIQVYRLAESPHTALAAIGRAHPLTPIT